MKKLDENLISLKEAAQISGYTADYIGQLIRAGKIPGKQVYLNIAWMTTAEAVLEYKNRGKTGDKPEKNDHSGWITGQRRKLGLQLELLRLFFRTFRFALPLLILLVTSFIVLSVYLTHILIYNPEQTITDIESPAEERQLLSF